MTDDERGAKRIRLDHRGKERLLARHSVEYVLRSLRLVAAHYGNDMILAVVANEIVAANVAHLTATHAVNTFDSLESVPPDELRRPVSALAVAGALGVPRETARRYIKRLEVMGMCRKVKGGYIVPSEKLSSPANNEVLEQNVANLRRFIDRLQDDGVLG
jgi:RNase P/RNase MRP subunit p30